MLLTIADLSRRWAISHQGAAKRTKRATFPAPAITSTAGRLWNEPEVQTWENVQKGTPPEGGAS